MPILSYTTHKKSSDKFIAWPFLDSMYDYEAFLKNNDKIASFEEVPKKSKIAIIGAGAAGLIAAYELMKTGLRPVIFEASGRIGGRLRSERFYDEQQKLSIDAETGSMRIPISHRVFFHYAEKFGIAYQEDPCKPHLVNSQLYYENTLFNWPKGEQLPSMQLKQIAEEWERFIRPFIDTVQFFWHSKDKLNGINSGWQEIVDQYKNKSFYEVLQESDLGWESEDFKLFGTLGIGSGGFASLYPISFLEVLRNILHEWDQDQQLISGGLENFCQHFYTHKTAVSNEMCSLESYDAVRFNHKVEDIRYNPFTKNPVLSYRNEAKENIKEEFDAIILAISGSALQMIQITLPSSSEEEILHEAQKSAIRNLHAVNATHMFIRTETKFWKNNPNLPQHIQTDQLVKNLYCVDLPHTDNGLVIINAVYGDDATKLLALSPTKRFKIYKDIINRINPEFAFYLEPLQDEIHSTDWITERHQYGAFKLLLPGQESDTQELYYQFLDVLNKKYPSDKGLYLAGDCVSWSGGWIEGALHTGINAACAVTKRLGASLKDDSPLNQNSKTYKYS